MKNILEIYIKIFYSFQRKKAHNRLLYTRAWGTTDFRNNSLVLQNIENMNFLIKPLKKLNLYYDFRSTISDI